MIKVALLVVTYNAEKYLPELLTSLFKLNRSGMSLTLVFVDNASTDRTVEILKQTSDDYVILPQEKNLGFAGGNNLGFSWAMDRSFDYVYLLNHDTVIDANALTEALKLAESKSSAATVQSKLLLYPETDKINSRGNIIHFLGFGYTLGYGERDSEIGDRSITYASGAAMLIRLSALKEIGLFDERFFMYHEDLDLGWRAGLLGYENYLAGRSVVYHKYEFGKGITKYYFMERNRFLVLLQNYKLATLIMIFPALIAMEGGTFFFLMLSGFWRPKLKAYAYFLRPRVWREILTVRNKRQTTRVVKDRELLALFTGRILFQEIANPLLVYVANPLFAAYLWMLRKVVWW